MVIIDYEEGENEFVHWRFDNWLFWLWVRHASLSFRFPTRKLSSELIQLWLSKAKQEGAKTENDPIVQDSSICTIVILSPTQKTFLQKNLEHFDL